MSNHEFENYLALVSRLMRLSRAQTALIRDELRDHLETRVSELTESGVDQNDAMRKALEEFGDATVLANHFQSVFQLNQRRWMMRFATFSIAGTFLAAVLVMAMWPSPARFGAPSSSIAQEENPFDNSSDEDLFGNDRPEQEGDPFLADSSSVSPDGGNLARVETGETTENEPQIATSEFIHQQLRKPCNLDFDEQPFIDVMDQLCDEYKMNVILDETARDDSLTEDELITIHVRNVSLSTALRLMLVSKNATYVIKNGILKIISLDSASDPCFFSRKIFDCRNLLQKIAATDSRVGKTIQVAAGRPSGLGPGAGIGARGGGGVFRIGSTYQLQQQPEKKQILQAPTAEKSEKILMTITAESILENLIKMTIDADGWDDTNGDGTLMTVSGFMVANQTQHTLDEMESFLNEFESRLK